MVVVHVHPKAESQGSRCIVLLIEDDPNDVFLFERAFRKSRIPCDIRTVDTVDEAMDYLNGTETYADREKFPLPDLIVTDLGFRGDSGLHFLNWLRCQSEFRGIPIVCVTGSSDPEKLRQARNFGARCIQKHAMYEGVVDLIRDLLPAPPA